MDIEIIKKELREINSILINSSIIMECYLFGSILHNSKLANDIDILIIYKCIDNVKYIKKSFLSLSSTYPLHLIFLSYSEEGEFNFIQQQNAEKIF
ncbi:putative nucleotidyltransferase [Chryseobacterium rhizosphaerae]|uniref:hypothetical protein n=1 Tax=Chryseobacterium rhizosphaerae TaxID=395937 RepID=UPI002865F049|nr:hypothetical protein [Chryseobacterium rhizosphaerae]MDR6548139.1 putative nucleotidyltransferase [Chryseobacterium rhizosphaerae]